MEKITLNVSMNKFLLRLILVSHILLTMKLPTDYLDLYSELSTRLLFVIIITCLAFYDIVSCVLAGMVLIFSNMEFNERQKLLV